MEKELDRLVQALADTQYCHICAKRHKGLRKAEAIHHIIGRANKMLRYEIANLLPVCYDCHRAIHDGKIKQEDYINPVIWRWLNQVKNQSYKDYLLFEMGGITKQEHLKRCKQTITSQLCKR